MLAYWSVLSSALVVLVAVRAVMSQHVVVLHWSRRGFFLLERGRDGRYSLFSPLWLPVVLVRFVALSVAFAVVWWPRRAVAWIYAHTRSVVGAKA